MSFEGGEVRTILWYLRGRKLPLCTVVQFVKAHDTLLFGLVWLRTKYGNSEPNAVTTVVLFPTGSLSNWVESSSQLWYLDPGNSELTRLSGNTKRGMCRKKRSGAGTR